MENHAFKISHHPEEESALLAVLKSAPDEFVRMFDLVDKLQETAQSSSIEWFGYDPESTGWDMFAFAANLMAQGEPVCFQCCDGAVAHFCEPDVGYCYTTSSETLTKTIGMIEDELRFFQLVKKGLLVAQAKLCTSAETPSDAGGNDHDE